MAHVRLIVVTGLPGSGKTELARGLARDCGAALIGKDTIKEAMMDAWPSSPLASRQLSDVAFAIMFALAKEALAAGVDVILEGNLRAREHEPSLRATLPARPVTIVQVLCRAPESVRQQRLAARAADPSRHWGHRDSQHLASVAACDAFLELPGERLLVDTADAITATLAACTGRLRAMLHSD